MGPKKEKQPEHFDFMLNDLQISGVIILNLVKFHTNLTCVVLQSMEATKALLRHSLHVTLETTLVSETHLLIQHWGSEECQSNFSKYRTTQPVPLTLQDT